MLTWSKVLGLCTKKKGKKAKWALTTLTGDSIYISTSKCQFIITVSKLLVLEFKFVMHPIVWRFGVQNYIPNFMISQKRITIFKLAFKDYGTKDYWKGEISADGWEMKKSWKIKRLTAEISRPLVFTSRLPPLQELGEGSGNDGTRTFRRTLCQDATPKSG